MEPFILVLVFDLSVSSYRVSNSVDYRRIVESISKKIASLIRNVFF